MESIDKFLEFADKYGLYPDLRIIEGSATPEVIIDSKKVLMFSSNNYLSLSTHPAVIDATIKAVKKYGGGSGGSRLLSGNLKVFRELEEKIVEFKGGEDAIIWPTGYSANVGIITAVMDSSIFEAVSSPIRFLSAKKNIILSDEINHASIIDGCKMTKQKVAVYKHLDMDDLERILKKHKGYRKFIVTDGVFSMDGDIAPLDRISNLAKQYDAITMVDEAHASGIIGKTGRGTLEHFNLEPIRDIDIVMGTLGKSFGSAGGFAVGSKNLIRFLRVASRSYMFSTAMTPATAGAAIAAINVAENEPKWRQQLLENSNYLREGFKKIGYNTLNSQTQIIPILIGSDEKAIKFSRKLFEKNIFGPAVRWPAVEKGRARIRVTVMAGHTKEQIDYLIKCCGKIGQELGIIK